MTLSMKNLQSIAQLAYLEPNDSEMETLANEVNEIIDFVEQLSQIDTTGVLPLFHPMDLHQRLRTDNITEEDCLAELAEIAPLFDQGMYLVPKVIDAGK